MAELRVLWVRILSLFGKKQAEQDLNDEVRAHLEMLEEENLRKGMSPDQARNAARQEFGGIEQMKESYRETGGLMFLETLWQDVRYSLRMIKRNPGFAFTVVVLLGLGIGANAAIFSGIDAIMLRLLPVKDPERLTVLQWSSQGYPREFVSDVEGGGQHHGSGGPNDFGGNVFSYATFTQLQEHSSAFNDAIGFSGNPEPINVGLNGRAESAIAQAVSGNYFENLGVPAIVGRTILPEDDQDAATPVAMASYSFWRQKLGQDHSVAGKTIVINGNTVTIVGVTPPEFFGLEPDAAPDLWITLHLYSRHKQQLGNLDNGLPWVADPKTWWIQIAGRLKGQTTEAQARAEADVLFKQSLRPAGGVATVADKMPRMEIIPAKRGLDTLRLQYSKSLLLLMAMSGVVLLIACSNVAGLMLVRATARQREIAIRLSLGARRARLMRQLLTESFLLATLGGGAGLLFAVWASGALIELLSSGRSPLHLELRINVAVLTFTAAVSIISGILFGVVPALRSTRRATFSVLKQGASGFAQAGRWLASGKVLSATQVGLTVPLLVGAALLLHTLRDLKNVDIGFARQQLLLFDVGPGLNGYTDSHLSNYYLELQRRIKSIPGVRSASFSTRTPIGEGIGKTGGRIPGYLENEVPFYRHVVGPEYFDSLQIPIIQGRAIGPFDTQDSSRVAVINQKLSQTYFHQDNPLGHQIVFGKRDYEIVGVAQDVKYGGLRTPIVPTVYFSYLQFNALANTMAFEVRGSGGVESLMAAIQNAANSLDKNVPIVNLQTQDEAIDQMLVLERTLAALSSALGGLALLLACIGLYGTMAYAVARRTNEIGVRMALGAQRNTILAMVLQETLLVVVLGLSAGFPLAWIATMSLQSQLFGLTAHDPATMFLAVLAIVVVTAIAGYIPARRASLVDPMVALRYE